MIKANELRLGNIVNFEPNKQHPYNPVVVKEIGEKEFMVDYAGNSLSLFYAEDNVSPIRLNPALLEKCGWVWNKECDSYEKLGDARTNLSYNDISNSYCMFNYVLRAKIADRIFYLHQLQNLYWCLCGQELTVNL